LSAADQRRRRPRAGLPVVTRRLLLRELEAADLAPLQRLAADRRVAEHAPAQSRALALVEQLASRPRPRAQRPRRSFELAIVLRRSGRLIGACDLAPSGRGAADIGYVLGRRHWGFGYGTEVATALVEFAFGILKLRRLVAVVAVENERSRRVLEKAGLRWDGLMRRHARFAGRWWDCHRYVIDRATWQAACARRGRAGS